MPNNKKRSWNNYMDMKDLLAYRGEMVSEDKEINNNIQTLLKMGLALPFVFGVECAFMGMWFYGESKGQIIVMSVAYLMIAALISTMATFLFYVFFAPVFATAMNVVYLFRGNFAIALACGPGASALFFLGYKMCYETFGGYKPTVLVPYLIGFSLGYMALHAIIFQIRKSVDE